MPVLPTRPVLSGNDVMSLMAAQVIISFRKLLLVCGTKLASDDTKVAGMLWIVFVTVAGLVAQIQTWPFASERRLQCLATHSFRA